ncbi:MAG: hypothetical protein R3F56_01550 [Planctomycetota bacterium]
MWNLRRLLPLTLIAAASTQALAAQRNVMTLIGATSASGGLCDETPACSYSKVHAAPGETLTLFANTIGAPFLVFASPSPASPCASIPGVAGSLVLGPPVLFAMELRAQGRLHDAHCVTWFASQQIQVPPLVPRGSRLYLQGLVQVVSSWTLTNAIELAIL